MLDNDFQLNDMVENVPAFRRPVVFNTEADMTANTLAISTWIAHYQNRLPKDAFIDEAAILVPDPWHRGELSIYLEANGWTAFNEDRDVVSTSPFGTRYCVDYRFFSHPDYGYRLEVMMLSSDAAGIMGFSPLHQALWQPSGQSWNGLPVSRYPIPHLSFKAVKVQPEQTLRGAYSSAVQHMHDVACLHTMTCQSQYGVFGYFLGNDTMRQIYLKPRVNLRDEA